MSVEMFTQIVPTHACHTRSRNFGIPACVLDLFYFRIRYLILPVKIESRISYSLIGVITGMLTLDVLLRLQTNN